MSELKPCPFCGSDALTFDEHPETCFIRLKERQMSGEAVPPTIAKEAWNTRAPDPILAELVEAAQAVHDECSKLRIGRFLNYGPMLEPSEGAVLRLRAALAKARKRGGE